MDKPQFIYPFPDGGNLDYFYLGATMNKATGDILEFPRSFPQSGHIIYTLTM